MNEHEGMAILLGDWHAKGTSCGGEDQWSNNPHAGATPWQSNHTARWHFGEFCIVQDERANGPFDTLSLMMGCGSRGLPLPDRSRITASLGTTR